MDSTGPVRLLERKGYLFSAQNITAEIMEWMSDSEGGLERLPGAEGNIGTCLDGSLAEQPEVGPQLPQSALGPWPLSGRMCGNTLKRV